MFSQAALRIELHRGNKLSVLDVQYDRALIGSGAHCDVRLAPDEAAVEQLVVEAIGDDEVYARTRALDPACLLNGAPFLEGRLSPTSMLELGSVALCVQRAARTDQVGERARRSSSTSPAVQALGLLGVGLGLWLVWSRAPGPDNRLADPVPPPPMAAIDAQVCPQLQPPAAAALAAQLELEAANMRERSPFVPSDSLSALPLFARAASCFAQAGEPERAREAKAAAEQLRSRVADEIHLRHVRLERYLAKDRYTEAGRQAQLLAELVADKTGPYAQWLSAVRRESELRGEPGGR